MAARSLSLPIERRVLGVVQSNGEVVLNVITKAVTTSASSHLVAPADVTTSRRDSSDDVVNDVFGVVTL